MRRALVALALAALAAAALSVAPAAGYKGYTIFRLNLDLDRNNESIHTQRVPHRSVDRTNVIVTDRCSGGLIQRRIAGPEEDLSLLRTQRADTIAGREIYVDLRARYNRNRGQVRLVGWRRTGGPNCRYVRQLWVYKRPFKPPRAARGPAKFDVAIRNVAPGFRGNEIVLDERFWRRGERYIPCASLGRRTLYRYSPYYDRYVRFARRAFRRSVPSGCRYV